MAAFLGMLRRDRERWGMRECQAAWCFGVIIREYRELEEGTRAPTLEPWTGCSWSSSTQTCGNEKIQPRYPRKGQSFG